MGVMITSAEADEIERAEQKVALSRAALARSLRQAEKTGANMVDRWQRQLKPAATVAVALVGAAAVLGVTIALVQRSRRHHHGWLHPQQPSRLGPVAKAVGVWALRIAARHVGEALVARLEQPAPSAPAATSASASVPAIG
jgi:hypothetical protein